MAEGTETLDRPFILAGGLLELGVCQLYRGDLDEAAVARLARDSE